MTVDDGLLVLWSAETLEISEFELFELAYRAWFREEPDVSRLERIFASALNIYLSGENGPRGCFTVVTAASEAVGDPEIRAMVLDGLAELDKAFANCFRRAREKGELSDSADPAVLAQLASATVHTIAIRSRARVPRKELEAIVKGAIDLMVGSTSSAVVPA